jgi:hypothetical protein
MPRIWLFQPTLVRAMQAETKLLKSSTIIQPNTGTVEIENTEGVVLRLGILWVLQEAPLEQLKRGTARIATEDFTVVEEAEVVVVIPLQVAVGVVLRDTRIEAHSAGGVVEAEAVMVAAETTTEVLEGVGVTMQV